MLPVASILPSSSSALHAPVTKQQVRKEREWRVINDLGVIEQKVARMIERAQAQADKKPKVVQTDFETAAAPKLFKFLQAKTETEGKAGIAHMQGRRGEMEDTHLVDEISYEKEGKTHQAEVFAIFDGHGGDMAAKFAAAHLSSYLKKHLEAQESPWNAFKLALVNLSDDFNATCRWSGCTATIAVKMGEELWVINVGDSRILIDNGGEVIQATEDAEPDCQEYKDGVLERGGMVKSVYGVARVNGMLAVARAIGDKSVGPGMTARPRITRYDLKELKPDAHLILACDGLFEVATSRQVVNRAHRLLKEGMPPELVAKDLIETAYKAGSMDNISAMVVPLV
jgi:protein phosphatase 1L